MHCTSTQYLSTTQNFLSMPLVVLESVLDKKADGRTYGRADRRTNGLSENATTIRAAFGEHKKEKENKHQNNVLLYTISKHSVVTGSRKMS